jgi:hypothetical protein
MHPAPTAPPRRKLPIGIQNLRGYGVPERQALNARIRLIEILKTANLPAMEVLLRSLFASIPNDGFERAPFNPSRWTAPFELDRCKVMYEGATSTRTVMQRSQITDKVCAFSETTRDGAHQ